MTNQTEHHAEAILRAAVPVGWLHELHMEQGQTYERLLDHDGTDEDEPSRTGFGIPGRDYSEEYSVTATPLYPASAILDAVQAERAAIVAWLRERSDKQHDKGYGREAVALSDAADTIESRDWSKP